MEIPTRFDLLWPVLKIVEEAGGSASVEEIVAQLGTEPYLCQLSIGPEALDVLHGDGPQTEIAYQAAWARTFLKYISALHNSRRGVWSITELGREIPSEANLRQLVRSELEERFRRRSTKKVSAGGDTSANDSELESSEFEEEWKQNLIEAVLELDPIAFERLCQRLLREAGFVDVEVTRSSGDGGIDGTGVLQLNLMSFRVGFQCKRYTNTPVPAKAIREFMGAIQGRADSGLFITTSIFSQAAKAETKVAGRLNVDLIDGDRLCDLLKEYELGAKTEKVERVEIDREFFQSI